MQVLDAYLVVKLHEAMFSMKAELQVMETQVANISKQKESLEKTLQAKTNYIRVSAANVFCVRTFALEVSSIHMKLFPVSGNDNHWLQATHGGRGYRSNSLLTSSFQKC